jgi:type IV secretion system protein VirD4
LRLVTRASLAVLFLIAGLAAGRLAGALVGGGWAAWGFVDAHRRPRPGTSHGTARWATPQEMDRLAPRPGHHDLLVGTVDGRLVAVSEERCAEHLILAAPTGAGKTAGLILPNLLAEDGRRSLIVTDPKRELLRLALPHFQSIYGDRVAVLDFLDPSIATGYNPLAAVRDAASANRFAQVWVANTGQSGSEPFWDNANRRLISAAALHLVADADGPPPPFAALADFLCGQSPERVRRALARSPAPEARRAAAAFLGAMRQNERLLGSVFTELPLRFECLDVPAVRATTTVGEFAPATLGRQPAALVLPFPLERLDLLRPLLAACFADLFDTLAAQAVACPDGRLATPVFGYLDEFGNLGTIPQFAQRLATVRSQGLGLFLVVQSLAQLRVAYGAAEADAILQNATTKLCLAGVNKGLESDDASYFSQLAGTMTVIGRTKDTSRQVGELLAGRRAGWNYGESGRALITPDELRTMTGEVLLLSGQSHPVRARQRRYYQVAALLARLPGPGDDPLAPLVAARAARPLPAILLGAAVADDDDGDIGADTWLPPHEPAAPGEVAGQAVRARQAAEEQVWFEVDAR